MMAGSLHTKIREGQMGCTSAGDCRGLCAMHSPAASRADEGRRWLGRILRQRPVFLALSFFPRCAAPLDFKLLACLLDC